MIRVYVRIMSCVCLTIFYFPRFKSIHCKTHNTDFSDIHYGTVLWFLLLHLNNLKIYKCYHFS